MPYIKPQDRFRVNETGSPTTPGELNYALTTLVVHYLSAKGVSYATFNDILGAMEGAKMEFYRRVVSPYEDRKMTENGDVYK